jgi:hypothetical protein
MPIIEVVYGGLIRTTVSCRSESYELSENATLRDLLGEIVRRHGPETERYLLDDSCRLASAALVAIGGFAVRDLNARLRGARGVEVVVLSPMMIGG